MNVIRRHICEVPTHIVRYYAVVQLDTGETVEVGSNMLLTDDEAIALAVQAVPPAPMPTIALEAEDGTIV